MRRNFNVALVSLGLLLGTTGCNSFLTGDKLSSDPNNPGSATIQTLLVGIQGGQFGLQEGTAAMMVCMWVQQCGATNGRFVEQAGRYVFGAGSNIGANGGDWVLVYAAGGLIDMDTIASLARVAKDDVYLGIDRSAPRPICGAVFPTARFVRVRRRPSIRSWSCTTPYRPC